MTSSGQLRTIYNQRQKYLKDKRLWQKTLKLFLLLAQLVVINHLLNDELIMHIGI